MYAVCYSAKVSSFYMLAKAGEPLSMQDAKEAHRRFFGVDPKGGHKYRNKEERQQFPLEERLQEVCMRARCPIDLRTTGIRGLCLMTLLPGHKELVTLIFAFEFSGGVKIGCGFALGAHHSIFVDS